MTVQLQGDDMTMEDARDLFDAVIYRHGSNKGRLAQN